MVEGVVRGRGRPSKYGVARTSSERNLERRLLMMGVVDAAEAWCRAHMVGSADLGACQVRLSKAVRAWRAYRGVK